MTITPSMARVGCAALGLCIFEPLVVLSTHLGFRLCIWMTQPVMGRDPYRRGSHSYLGWLLDDLLPPGLGVVWGRDRDLGPTL
jgi:hypothetical protein